MKLIKKSEHELLKGNKYKKGESWKEKIERTIWESTSEFNVFKSKNDTTVYLVSTTIFFLVERIAKLVRQEKKVLIVADSQFFWEIPKWWGERN